MRTEETRSYSINSFSIIARSQVVSWETAWLRDCQMVRQIISDLMVLNTVPTMALSCQLS